VITISPLVALGGTDTVMLVSLHDDGVAAAPLNRTVLAPCVAPKFVPVSVTVVPECPVSGIRDASIGVGNTVNGSPLLATPPTVTTMFPLVAPTGTDTVKLVSLHSVGVASVPLNVRVLEPCDAPKFAPLMETDAPTGPNPGVRYAMKGVGNTVNE
jgi:hypothetical protein